MSTTVWFILFIFIGAVFKVIASYAHLIAADWTFLGAFLLAVPFVMTEYNFSLRGNKWAFDSGLSPVSILLMTLCFYFVAMYGLNRFWFGKETKLIDLASFGLIAAAFYLSFRDSL